MKECTKRVEMNWFSFCSQMDSDGKARLTLSNAAPECLFSSWLATVGAMASIHPEFGTSNKSLM